MANYVGSVSAVVVPIQTAEPTPPPAPPAPANDTDPGRYRLSIEAIGRGRFVYRVVDRITGEVVRQLPREDVVRLINDPDYPGGKVIDTRA